MSASPVEFWQWFESNAATWPIPEDDFSEQQSNALFDALDEFFPELTCTISCLPNEYLEIQFSAKLRPEMAPLILEIEAAAPAYPNWRFVFFQPKLGFYDLYVGAQKLPFKKVPTAELRVVVKSPDPLHLAVYWPQYDASASGRFDIATRLSLEAGMGERWLLEELRELSVGDVGEAPPDAVPLAELPSLLGRVS